eukprot:10652402-Ditylum_brightwellii.AAC.1
MVLEKPKKLAKIEQLKVESEHLIQPLKDRALFHSRIAPFRIDPFRIDQTWHHGYFSMGLNNLVFFYILIVGSIETLYFAFS